MFWNKKKTICNGLAPTQNTGWISVNDELPKDGQLVWVLHSEDKTNWHSNNPSINYKFVIVEGKFFASKGWDLKGIIYPSVFYWTLRDYTGVSSDHEKYIGDK